MKRAARKKKGSVVFDKRRGTWNHLDYINGKRKSRLIGYLEELPDKNAAERKFAEEQSEPTRILVEDVTARYREERMPERMDTRRSYEVWLNNHILPKWGKSAITGLRARPVELWLRSLPLSPKSKVHIRGLIRVLWDFAMWRDDIPIQVNPMEKVRIHRASKRTKQPRNLTVDEFQRFAQNLGEPFRTVAVLCVCFGLRISECLGLKWCDVDWLRSTLRIERSIVAQKVDETKTDESRKELPMDDSLLEFLKGWRQAAQFSLPQDWVFASPVHLGRLPWSYDQIWRVYQKAASAAGIGRLGTHALRHTYRSWLDSVGTSLAVQQKLMRHADIRTTMNIYGDVVTDEMREAQGKVGRLAVPAGPGSGSQRIARSAN